MKPTLAETLKWPMHGYTDTQALARQLASLRERNLDHLPLPGSGDTLERWMALAAVGGHDLGLCKLFEGHTDALAIMAELDGPPPPPGSLWGTWAAEPPDARVHVQRGSHLARLDGRKAWCSGAAVLSHALLTCWDEDGEQQLVAVDLRQPGVTVTSDGWNAVGMAATGSVEVLFNGAEGLLVGGPGDYVHRPGFWQGGIGIAACWFGASRSLAEALHRQCGKRAEPHALAHLGAVDTALHSAICALRNAAREIDAAPGSDAQRLARRVRAVVEASAQTVIEHVGRALGAGPYCKDAHFAQLIADLPVFLRQSHAERDLAALGEQLTKTPGRPWQL